MTCTTSRGIHSTAAKSSRYGTLFARSRSTFHCTDGICQEAFPQDELIRLADGLDVVPAVLKEQGKAKNPAPNVDAISGALQYYYGVREFNFNTGLFGVGRALGVTANNVWARALGQPLERPKTLTTKMLEDIVAKSAEPA